MEPLSRNTLLGILAVLLLAVAAYQERFIREVWQLTFHPETVVRDPLGFRVPPEVDYVAEEAREAGLQQGDRVTAVQGKPFTGFHPLGQYLAQAKPGERLQVEVERSGRRLEAAIVLAPTPPAEGRLLRVTLVIVLPVFCIALGFTLVWLRPWDHRAWILLGLLLSFSAVFASDVSVLRWSGLLYPVGVGMRVLLPLTWPMWMVLLGLHFPARPPLRWMQPMGWALVAPVLAFALLQTAVVLARGDNLALARQLHIPGSAALGFNLLSMVSVGFYFLSIGLQTGKGRTADLRRRAALLLWGSHICFLPAFLLVLRALFTRQPAFGGQLTPWMAFALAMMALYPLLLAYLIVVHQALDLRLVLRTGLQYALARQALFASQCAIGLAAGFYLQRALRSGTVRWELVVPLVVVAIGFYPVTKRLGVWIDKRFFREAYDSEQILSDLGEEVRSIAGAGPLLERVAGRISEALHVPRVTMLLRQDGAYSGAGLHVPEATPAIARLRATGRPQFVNDDATWPDPNGQLLLPLPAKDGLAGVIHLGPKLSEEPYTPSDVRLLRSVAVQTGLALENSQLAAAMAHQMAQREQQEREMAIAREVQQRLFPHRLPKVAGLDYFGICRPAQSVGGDYYDFLELPGGEFAIAVGDVSGKGMPAALLMSALQASVRGQALNQITDLAVHLRNVNLLLYDMSPKSHFATLFYALYENASRRLVYANAGHNPPLLLRASGEGQPLRPTGPGVGLTRLSRYSSAALTLAAGDVLIAYTDGFTEAMNPAREEFGEDRLQAALRAAALLPSREIATALIAAVDAFAAGAAQHDDMTLVVVKAL